MSSQSGARRKIARRVKELVAEEMTMRELRKARKMTQVQLGGSTRHQAGAKSLGLKSEQTFIFQREALRRSNGWHSHNHRGVPKRSAGQTDRLCRYRLLESSLIRLILAMEEFGKRFPGFERETPRHRSRRRRKLLDARRHRKENNAKRKSAAAPPPHPAATPPRSPNPA